MTYVCDCLGLRTEIELNTRKCGSTLDAAERPKDTARERDKIAQDSRCRWPIECTRAGGANRDI